MIKVLTSTSPQMAGILIIIYFFLKHLEKRDETFRQVFKENTEAFKENSQVLSETKEVLKEIRDEAIRATRN